jgi:hypothetical protein
MRPAPTAPASTSSNDAPGARELVQPVPGQRQRFADISLNQWVALTPPALVREHLHVGDGVLRALRREKRPVVSRA